MGKAAPKAFWCCLCRVVHDTGQRFPITSDANHHFAPLLLQGKYKIKFRPVKDNTGRSDLVQPDPAKGQRFFACSFAQRQENSAKRDYNNDRQAPQGLAEKALALETREAEVHYREQQVGKDEAKLSEGAASRERL